jgi:hypothetical protein
MTLTRNASIGDSFHNVQRELRSTGDLYTIQSKSELALRVPLLFPRHHRQVTAMIKGHLENTSKKLIRKENKI